MSDLLTFKSNVPGRLYREVVVDGQDGGVIGKGGESLVYKAVQVDEGIEGRIVAVKDCKIKTTAEDGWTIRKRFGRQAEFMDKLRHPNVVDFYEFVDESKRFLELHLIMEYLAGKSLRQILKNENDTAGEPLPLHQIARITEQFISALEHAHHQTPPIIHRDLKPEQIMVGDDGLVKVLDFGAAKEYDPTHTATQFTSAGATFQYAAPEQWGLNQRQPRTKLHVGLRGIKRHAIEEVPIDKAYSPATDVYAVSVMLYEMLTGQFMPRSPENFHHYIPNDVDVGRFKNLIERGTAWKPEERATLADIKNALGIKSPPQIEIVTAHPITPLMAAIIDELEAQKRDQPSLETALAKPTGALVPMAIDNIDALLPPTEKSWYIRWAPGMGIALGAAVTALITYKYPVSYKLPMIILDNQRDLLTKLGVDAVGGIIGFVSGIVTRDALSSQSSTRALAAPDEGYKKRSWLQRIEERIVGDTHEEGYTVLGGVIGALSFGVSTGLVTDNPVYAIVGAITGLVVGGFYGESKKDKTKKRKEFREVVHYTLLEAPHAADIEAVLQQVEVDYGTRALKTFAHNYAHKMLEEGKYDEVVKVGVHALDYVTEQKKEGYFAGRRAKRRESELLENICLGLVRKGALDELRQLT